MRPRRRGDMEFGGSSDNLYHENVVHSMGKKERKLNLSSRGSMSLPVGQVCVIVLGCKVLTSRSRSACWLWVASCGRSAKGRQMNDVSSKEELKGALEILTA